MARSYFAMALVLICAYGFVQSDEYPARPILMTLLLFPIAMLFTRFLFRPNQHPSPNPVRELEIATQVMRDHRYPKPLP